MLENANAVLIGIGVQTAILIGATIWLARWLYKSFKRG